MKLLVLLGILFCLRAEAISEFDFDQIWMPTPAADSQYYMDVTVNVEEKSSWTKSEIQDRLLRANHVLNQCQVSIGRVFFQKWKLPSPLLRVDDIDDSQAYYDGMRDASARSRSGTSVELFYFQDYQNPFTWGPSVPLAVYESPKLPKSLHGTAWFPYKSAQRRLGFQYSEEAHEIGHLLLQSGHDHSDLPNIMAANSALRTDHFDLNSQCPILRSNASLRPKHQCEKLRTQLQPFMNRSYWDYSKDSYMALWCARNTDNLQSLLHRYGAIDPNWSRILFVRHKTDDYIYPQAARGNVHRWTFHAALLVSGYVLDLDFSESPSIVPLEDWIKKMWGPQANNLIFQAIPISEIPGYTREIVFDSFLSQDFPVMDAAELTDWSRSLRCK